MPIFEIFVELKYVEGDIQMNKHNLANHDSLGFAEPGSAHTSLMHIERAKVSGQVEDWFFIQGLMACERAKSATSCLILPEIGDEVLVCRADDQSPAYILAVLTRKVSSEGVLRLPGGASIHAERGDLTIHAKELSLQGKERVQVDSAHLSVNTEKTGLKIKHLHAWIDVLETYALQANLVTKNMTMTVGRLMLRARESFRWVDELDETRAGRVRVKVNGRFQMQTEHTTIQAEGIVKIDGQKIDLG